MAGVSKTIAAAAVAVATAFRVLYWWRQHCKQISNGCLEIFKKIITLLTLTVLFLFTFFTLILDAPHMFSKFRTYPYFWKSLSRKPLITHVNMTRKLSRMALYLGTAFWGPLRLHLFRCPRQSWGCWCGGRPLRGCSGPAVLTSLPAPHNNSLCTISPRRPLFCYRFPFKLNYLCFRFLCFNFVWGSNEQLKKTHKYLKAEIVPWYR